MVLDVPEQPRFEPETVRVPIDAYGTVVANIMGQTFVASVFKGALLAKRGDSSVSTGAVTNLEAFMSSAAGVSSGLLGADAESHVVFRRRLLGQRLYYMARGASVLLDRREPLLFDVGGQNADQLIRLIDSWVVGHGMEGYMRLTPQLHYALSTSDDPALPFPP